MTKEIEDEGFLKASKIGSYAEEAFEGLVDDFDNEGAARLVESGLTGMVEESTKVVEGFAVEFAPDGVKGVADSLLDVDD